MIYNYNNYILCTQCQKNVLYSQSLVLQVFDTVAVNKHKAKYITFHVDLEMSQSIPMTWHHKSNLPVLL